ncbi:MAG: bifunctional trypsin-like peptidase domain-containing/SEL1-like repeat protein [Candidatus Thermoplasmatota archaeon]|nr:bifunctional trypsin-like peptidase domain-containing/SEL1-like repeat protein [Candidatus Thermoplasmatota archaeon]
MNQELHKSVFLVRSNIPTKNGTFGTAFCIYQDRSNYSYFLTCAHVINRLGGPGSLLLEDYDRETKICCLDNLTDLAVIQIKDSPHNIPILKINTTVKRGDPFSSSGYSIDSDTIICRPINGKIGSPITLQKTAINGRVDAWDLIVEDYYGLQEGYSGSPVFNINTNTVCGVVAIRTDDSGTKGIAISITALSEIWSSIPKNLLSSQIFSSSIDVNTSDNSNSLFKAGYAAYQKKEFSKAFDLFIAAAENGNADSQNVLGLMYVNGEGAEKDCEKARLWFLKSALQNHAPAQLNIADLYKDILRADQEALPWYFKLVQNENASVEIKASGQFKLGIMYEHGKGIPLNDIEAFEWFLKSAKNNNPDGQNKVGEMYRDGRGVTQNYEEAFSWFQRSADQENIQALYNIGIMFLKGTGIPEDDLKAFQYISKAAAKHHSNAEYYLGFMYEFGKVNKTDEKQAFNWYSISANQNNSDAQNRLGLIYERGIPGIQPNYTDAIKWFKNAASNENPDGEFNLGRMYYEAKGTKRNLKEAAHWFKKAAEKGHAEAQYYLGYILYYGCKEFSKDYIKAIELFHAAARQDHILSQFYLAIMLDNGFGIKKNSIEATKWFKIVIEKKEQLPVMKLGYLYENGKGVKQDYIIALKLYHKALLKGDNSANVAIKRVQNILSIQSNV